MAEGFRRLEDLLVDKGLLTPEQEEHAHRAAARLGTSLLNVLLGQDVVGEQDLFEALQDSLSLPRFDPDMSQVDPDALRLVPLEDAQRNRVLPLQIEQVGRQRLLHLAMVNPLDSRLIEELEYVTALGITPVLALNSHLQDAIGANYQGIVTKVIQRPPPHVDLDPGDTRASRQPFGGQIGGMSLDTQPMGNLVENAPTRLGLLALLRVLLRKSLITQKEFEEELAAITDSTPQSE